MRKMNESGETTKSCSFLYDLYWKLMFLSKDCDKKWRRNNFQYVSTQIACRKNILDWTISNLFFVLTKWYVFIKINWHYLEHWYHFWYHYMFNLDYLFPIVSTCSSPKTHHVLVIWRWDWTHPRNEAIIKVCLGTSNN